MTLTCITCGTEFKREYSYGSFFDWHLDSKGQLKLPKDAFKESEE